MHRTPTHSRFRFRGLFVARVLWLALTALALEYIVRALPLVYRVVLRAAVNSDIARFIDRLGVSPVGYARFIQGLFLIAIISYIAVAVVIFWRRSDDWFALFVSLSLVAIGARFIVVVGIDDPARLHLRWSPAELFLNVLSFTSPLLLFYLFPDGRFVPRWTRLPAAIWVVWTIVAQAAGAETVIKWLGFPWFLWPWLIAYGSGAVAQIYRYRHMSSQVQRQQTKWVALGLTAPVVVLALVYLISIAQAWSLWSPARSTEAIVEEFVVRIVPLTALLVVPLTIAVALLRYRLWDVDVLINRALVYGLLTVALSLIYVGAVVVFQRLLQRFAGTAQSPAATVASTLLLVAMFQPLRLRIQRVIDRHFYRRKYDAARTLEAFNARVRDQVELSALTGDVLDVVQDTLQPAHVSLWLRPTERK